MCLVDSYSTQELTLEWVPGEAIVLNDQLELPQFELTEVEREEHCVKKYEQTGLRSRSL